MKKIKFLAILLLLIPSISLAANHHINPACENNGDGTTWECVAIGQPGAFNAIPASLTRGDTYYLASGTYPAYIFDDVESGTDYIYIKKATISVHGTATGWNDSYATGQALFTSGLTYTLLFKRSYYDINGVTGGGPTTWTTGHGIKITTTEPTSSLVYITHNGNGTPVADHISISHCEIEHLGPTQNINAGGSYGNIGISIKPTGGTASAGGHYFGYNYVHEGVTELFYAYKPGSFTIEYNWFERSSAYEEEGSEKQGSGNVIYEAQGGIIRNNVYHNIVGSCWICLYSWHGVYTVNDVKVYNNLFYNDSDFKSGGVVTSNGVVGTDGCDSGYGCTSAGVPRECCTGLNTGTCCVDEKVTNILVYGNTIVRAKGYLTLYIPDGTTGNIAKNNIFYGCWGVPTTAGDMAGFARSYNWYYGNADYRGAHASLDAEWIATEIEGTQTGTGNPFISETDNFNLSDCSGAGCPKNNGVTLGSPYNVDIVGTSRPSGTGYDIGAYEFDEEDTTAPVISAPLPSGAKACSSNPLTQTLQVTTDENATCKWHTSDVAYDSMSNTFESTGGITHTDPELFSCSASYTRYVRCSDVYGNKSAASTEISFSVDAPPTTGGAQVWIGTGAGIALQ